MASQEFYEKYQNLIMCAILDGAVEFGSAGEPALLLLDLDSCNGCKLAGAFGVHPTRTPDFSVPKSDDLSRAFFEGRREHLSRAYPFPRPASWGMFAGAAAVLAIQGSHYFADELRASAADAREDSRIPVFVVSDDGYQVLGIKPMDPEQLSLLRSAVRARVAELSGAKCAS